MPYTTAIDCPHCERPLHRKPAGTCPHCGTPITAHVVRQRRREKRIEQTVAVFATGAVLALFVWAGGLGLIEGVAVYCVAGLGVWYWGKGTFWRGPRTDDAGPDGPAAPG